MTDITREKLSSMRKYFIEYSVVVLISAVVGLFKLYVNMQDFVTKDLMEQNTRLIITIEKNTAALNNLKLR